MSIGVLGGDAIAEAALAGIAYLPNRRMPHYLASLGDSRDLLYTDSLKQQKAWGCPLNVACALSMQRYVVISDQGYSGRRTDEYIGLGLANILASKVGTVRIIGILNDVGQDYPTASTSGTTAANNIIAAAEQMRAAGINVIIERDPGQTGIATTRLQQIAIGNAILWEYATQTPGVYWHDACAFYQVSGASTSQITLDPNMTYDALLTTPVTNTHPNNRGSYYWAKSLKNLLDSITSPRSIIPTNINQLPANGGRQILPNFRFATATGGTLSNGATGTTPNSVVGNMSNTSGSATVAYSTVSDPGGAGNNVVMTCNFGGSRDNGRMTMTASNSDWNAGDWFQAMALVSFASAPTALSSVALTANLSYDNNVLLSFGDGIPVTAGGSGNLNNTLGPDEAFSALLLTQPFQIPSLTVKGFLGCTLYAYGSGSGTATMTVPFVGLMKRQGGY